MIGNGKYHAFPDDEKLAIELLELSNEYSSCKQLGIDMLLRLNKWSKICAILLKEGEIDVSIRLFLENYPYNRKNNTENLNISHFLQTALQQNPVTFYHLYQSLSLIKNSEFQTHLSQFKIKFDHLCQKLGANP